MRDESLLSTDRPKISFCEEKPRPCSVWMSTVADFVGPYTNEIDGILRLHARTFFLEFMFALHFKTHAHTIVGLSASASFFWMRCLYRSSASMATSFFRIDLLPSSRLTQNRGSL